MLELYFCGSQTSIERVKNYLERSSNSVLSTILTLNKNSEIVTQSKRFSFNMFRDNGMQEISSIQERKFWIF